MTTKQRRHIDEKMGSPIISRHYKPVYYEKLENILLTETEMLVIHSVYFELRKSCFRKGKTFFHEQFLRECMEEKSEPFVLSIGKIKVHDSWYYGRVIRKNQNPQKPQKTYFVYANDFHKIFELAKTNGIKFCADYCEHYTYCDKRQCCVDWKWGGE